MTTTINLNSCAPVTPHNRVIATMTCGAHNAVPSGTAVTGNYRRIFFGSPVYELKVTATFSVKDTATLRMVFDTPSEAIAELLLQNASAESVDSEYNELFAVDATSLTNEVVYKFPLGLTVLDIKAVGAGIITKTVIEGY